MRISTISPAFFDAMAKMPRIVSISDFKLNQTDKQSDQRTLHRAVPLVRVLRRTGSSHPCGSRSRSGSSCTRTRTRRTSGKKLVRNPHTRRAIKP